LRILRTHCSALREFPQCTILSNAVWTVFHIHMYCVTAGVLSGGKLDIQILQTCSKRICNIRHIYS